MEMLFESWDDEETFEFDERVACFVADEKSLVGDK